MKTKIVYILTFNDCNYFFEQALVSVCSCRMHNPDAEIIILMDKDSASLVTGWREIINNYINYVVPIDVPIGLNGMQTSRWLKTNLRNLIDGDFLFIDTDTIICKPLGEIDNLDGDIYAVADMHCPIELSRSELSIRNNFNNAGLADPSGIFFNSGVMYVRDTETARRFYERWHMTWDELTRKKIFIDQVSLYKVNKDSHNLIKELPGEWNCQTEGLFINYLSDSYIIHYYSFSKKDTKYMFFFKNQKVFEEIRASESITETIYEQILNPRKAFTMDYLILSGPLVERYHKMKYIHSVYGSPKRFWILQQFARILS